MQLYYDQTVTHIRLVEVQVYGAQHYKKKFTELVSLGPRWPIGSANF